jgi:hypothetical protein
MCGPNTNLFPALWLEIITARRAIQSPEHIKIPSGPTHHLPIGMNSWMLEKQNFVMQNDEGDEGNQMMAKLHFVPPPCN